MALDPIIINNTAWELAKNASIMPAATMVYTNLIGDWFWAIMLIFLLGLTYIRTEDFTYVLIYGLLGVLGLSVYGLFPDFFRPITYLIMGIGMMITLYEFFGRSD